MAPFFFLVNDVFWNRFVHDHTACCKNSLFFSFSEFVLKNVGQKIFRVNVWEGRSSDATTEMWTMSSVCRNDDESFVAVEAATVCKFLLLHAWKVSVQRERLLVFHHNAAQSGKWLLRNDFGSYFYEWRSDSIRCVAITGRMRPTPHMWILDSSVPGSNFMILCSKGHLNYSWLLILICTLVKPCLICMN